MKPSHLTTPRTLADSTFTTGYRTAEQPRYSVADRAVMWASLIAAIACALIVAFVPQV